MNLVSASVDAALELADRAQRSGWEGPDPYDALWWHWPNWLVGGRRRRQALVQSHARAPFDVRKLYRRRHPRIPKTLGLFASAGLRAHALTGDQPPLALAVRALEMLSADRSAGPRAWGYPFDVQTRWTFYPAGDPNVVVTAFSADALLEAAGMLGREDFETRARGAAEWVLEELWVESGGFFGYHTGSRVNVHNANLLGAVLVHRAFTDDPNARRRVARAVDRTLYRQARDGSWPYGESSNLAWVDSFHTGFVLQSLSRLEGVDPAVNEAISRGSRFYERFFDAAGRATLWPDRRFPEDAHAAGTGLSALAVLYGRGDVQRDVVERVARRTLRAGVKDGAAVARRYRWGRTSVWYPRWCDAHVSLGLIDAARALSVAGPPTAG